MSCSQNTALLHMPTVHPLQDKDDDVRAASADALVPVASTLTQCDPMAVGGIRHQLWTLLVQLEELSPATMSVMQLLAHLYAQPASSHVGDELAGLVPRLWPFMRHSLSTVRLATVQCLEQLLSASITQHAVGWLQGGAVLEGALRLVFQNLLMEGDDKVQQASLRVWQLLMDAVPPSNLLGVVMQGEQTSLLRAFFALASTPGGKTLDRTLMVAAQEGGAGVLVPMVKVEAPQPATNGSAGGSGASTSAPSAKRARQTLSSTSRSSFSGTAAANGSGGPRYVGSRADFVVGSLGEGSAVRMRLLTSQALGLLCSKLCSGQVGAD